MAQLMPLSPTVSCFSKIQTGFSFPVPAHPGSPGQRAVKRVYVCRSVIFPESCNLLLCLCFLHYHAEALPPVLWPWWHYVFKFFGLSVVHRCVYSSVHACIRATNLLITFSSTSCIIICLQCFDAVGWAGVVICQELGADLHMAQLMPLPLTVSCFSKIQIGFTFLVPAHPGSPGKKALKRVCVCSCIIIEHIGTARIVCRAGSM